MGIVDVLVPKGQGVVATETLIRQQKRISHSYLAMNAARNLAQAVPYEELLRITEVWVDTALALNEKSLRTMGRLVKAQNRRAGTGVA